MASDSISGFLNSIGPYQTIGLCLLLGIFGPFSTNWNWQQPPSFGSSFESLPSLIFLIWLLTTSSNLSGPIRYGIHAYSQQVLTFTRQTPNWQYIALLIFALLPISRTFLIVLAPVGWQYIRERHREAVQELRTRVDNAVQQAMTAANNAKADAVATASYEYQAVEIAAGALRDARQADALKVTDFFDKSCEAWVAVHRVVELARKTTEAAEDAMSGASELQEESPSADDDDASGTGDIVEKAEMAHEAAQQAEEASEKAWAMTAEFKEAREYADKMRASERTNAAKAVYAAENVVVRSAAAASAAARKAAEKANYVRRLAAISRDAALKGNMDEANSSAVRAENGVGEVNNEAATAASSREAARTNVMIKPVSL